MKTVRMRTQVYVVKIYINIRYNKHHDTKMKAEDTGSRMHKHIKQYVTISEDKIVKAESKESLKSNKNRAIINKLNK